MTTIYVSYQMVKVTHYDLFILIRDQFLKILKVVKTTKKNETFHFDLLAICLLLYFANILPREGRVFWSKDKPIAHKIEMILRKINKLDDRYDQFIELFAILQNKMHKKDRIPLSMIEKYKKYITFIITTRHYIMQDLKPREKWLSLLGYEITEQVEEYDRVLLSIPINTTKERFITIEYKNFESYSKKEANYDKKKVDKIVMEARELSIFTKEERVKYIKRVIHSSNGYPSSTTITSTPMIKFEKERPLKKREKIELVHVA